MPGEEEGQDQTCATTTTTRRAEGSPGVRTPYPAPTGYHSRRGGWGGDVPGAAPRLPRTLSGEGGLHPPRSPGTLCVPPMDRTERPRSTLASPPPRALLGAMLPGIFPPPPAHLPGRPRLPTAPARALPPAHPRPHRPALLRSRCAATAQRPFLKAPRRDATLSPAAANRRPPRRDARGGADQWERAKVGGRAPPPTSEGAAPPRRPRALG